MLVHVRLRFLFVVRPSLARAPLLVDAGAGDRGHSRIRWHQARLHRMDTPMGGAEGVSSVPACVAELSHGDRLVGELT